jgi:CIC family chloride channel protein
VGTLARRRWPDARALLAAGAGAGLAAAFNAPTAGAVFVLEELVRRFEPRMAIAALAASTGAIFVSRIVLGDAPDFAVGSLPDPSAATMPLHLALGVIAGLLAAGYNWTLIAALAAADHLRRCPVELRAGLIGATVGALAWFAPDLVGGGDPITQRALAGSGTLAILPLVFLLRFVLGAVSYAAGTPGGLFAPLLVLGAQLGLCFGILSRMMFPDLDMVPQGFAVVGMAAFFAGVVRAPVTGITLVVEMTANVTMLLPMLGASFVAMLVPTLLGNAPIYDSLRPQGLSRDRVPDK